jgi:hypothetical protein
MNIYALCDSPILKAEAAGEPGRVLRRMYRGVLMHPALKYGVLRWCNHPGIRPDNAEKFQRPLREAMASAEEQWSDAAWVRNLLAPFAELLDAVREPEWRVRSPAPCSGEPMPEKDLDELLEAAEKDVLRVWGNTPEDPHFPVAAQIVLPGDDQMDGESFLDAMAGLGAPEYRFTTLLFGLARIFIAENPTIRRLLRKPYPGVSEPLRLSPSWIMHRTAFYDAIFFEQIMARLTRNDPPAETRRRLEDILESLIRYLAATSREELAGPRTGLPHPGITCLPKDAAGNPLCAMSAADWKKKKDLGFDDYVPDIDTTYLTVTMASRWLDYAAASGRNFDAPVLDACRDLVSKPWADVFREYQVRGGYGQNPQLIRMKNPLDIDGSAPLWLHKTFCRSDERTICEALGNEVCAGHNMDILETLLRGRRLYNIFEGENLEATRRLIDFHYRAFTTGTYRDMRSVRFYLPIVYAGYAGRMWETWESISREERLILDPEGKIDVIRDTAARYLAKDILGFTCNPLDAAMAVTGLCQLGRRDTAASIAHGLRRLRDAVGEGPKASPFKAYEWTLVRYPSRIIVGSPVTTSLFVLSACAEAKSFLYGPDRLRS